MNFETIRYYFEVIFDTAYFPFWEFTVLCIVFLTCSIIFRLHRIEQYLKHPGDRHE